MRRRNSSGSANEIVAFIFILLFITGYIITAHMTLDEETRRVPLLTSYVTLFFLFLEISRRTFLQNFLMGKSADSAVHVESSGDTSLIREAKVILSVVGLIAGIYLVGFFMGIFLYIVFAIAYLGVQPLRLAVFVALITDLVVYLVFELALEYQLFPGILFS